MILAIDTSSARSALALIDAAGRVVHEEIDDSGPKFDLPSRYRKIAGAKSISRVAVATGPGSFTGLRVGVSFGLGLAMGRRIPIVPLPTLAVQAARAEGLVLAVAEAGRGRVYYQSPDGGRGVAEPGELPREWPVVGWLRPVTQAALEAAGLRIERDQGLRTFGSAAARLLESASEVAYGSVKLEYMQSFSARTR
ncbi:MAG: tRNA (adenosine(37)-N6)-threonylcarbamoyltransferase complex dimerization subunit type 1 TsaB [Chloroflexi bacterium]|nr:MAG: tRNA (adenosine(37)-N6)-threonylcarbamoyltransferase complex dimerization subunit type 1 TsaB [Chloroflexota bacterium]